jgi:hypothetical protein
MIQIFTDVESPPYCRGKYKEQRATLLKPLKVRLKLLSNSLRPGVNFTNILRTAFSPIFLQAN